MSSVPPALRVRGAWAVPGGDGPAPRAGEPMPQPAMPSATSSHESGAVPVMVGEVFENVDEGLRSCCCTAPHGSLREPASLLDHRLSPGDVLELDEVLSSRVTLFPLLLLGLVGRQGNLELLLVYYLARLLGRLNVRALARYEGRDLGSSTPDELVAEQEATFVRKAQEEVFGQLGLVLFLQATFFLLVGGFVAYQLGALVLGLLTPAPPDPLAF